MGRHQHVPWWQWPDLSLGCSTICINILGSIASRLVWGFCKGKRTSLLYHMAQVVRMLCNKPLSISVTFTESEHPHSRLFKCTRPLLMQLLLLVQVAITVPSPGATITAQVSDFLTPYTHLPLPLYIIMPVTLQTLFPHKSKSPSPPPHVSSSLFVSPLANQKATKIAEMGALDNTDQYFCEALQAEWETYMAMN